MSSIHLESSPSSQEVQTQQAPSPPQPQEAPQPQETSPDVLDQTADPVDPIIQSVVSSEQTSTVSPQGKLLPITSTPMNLPPQIISNLIIFSVDIVPSATRADRPVVPIASTSQRHEIVLKQVSYLISIPSDKYLMIK